MISDKNKRIEITLSKEDAELLNSLSLRFHITKSETIRQALKIFAAKRKHIYQIKITESKPLNEPLEPIDEEAWNI